MGCIPTKETKETKSDLSGDLGHIKKFTFSNLKTNARVVDVHDGDTITVVFIDDTRKPPHDRVCINLRIFGIDTPETHLIKTNSDSALHKECGLLVRDYVKALLAKVEFIQINILCDDKYSGRWVASVKYGDKDLSEHLLAEKLALPYEGKKKTVWTTEALTAIKTKLAR